MQRAPQIRPLDTSFFSKDALDFIRLLTVRQVRYVMVGGEAVIYYGYPRFTGDIDFFTRFYLQI